MTTAASVAIEPTPRPGGQRGRLNIADRVVAKIARRAAAEVDGIELSSVDELNKTFGRATSSVHTRGGRTVVTVTVAIVYPRPVYDGADRVRRHVADRLGELADLRDVEVTVHVGELVIPGQPTGRRVE